MSASGGDTSRRVNWSAVKDPEASMRAQLVRFVGGIRGERHTPVTKAQILRWFRGTPAEFVEKALTAAVTDGAIEIEGKSLSSTRRASGAFVYSVPTTDDAEGQS